MQDATGDRGLADSGARTLVFDLFASPVGLTRWSDIDEINRELREAILERYRSSPGTVKTNRKGWQSDADMQTWAEPCVAQFLQMVRAAAARYMAHLAPGIDPKLLDNWEVHDCWANINPPGGYNRPHNHTAGGSLLSGFYYLDVGVCAVPTDAGRTIFEDHGCVPLPVPSSGDLRARECAVVPEPGVMAIFSAAQYHYVEPFRGDGARMSIAFNLRHPSFGILYYADMEDPGFLWTNFRGLMILQVKIPQMLRAATLALPYIARELRRGEGSSLGGKVRSALRKASADAAAQGRDEPRAPAKQLPEKRILKV